MRPRCGLRVAGIDDAMIADCVGVDPDALPTFMRVPEAKARRRIRRATDLTKAVVESSDRFAARLLENENGTPVPAKICR
jgi:hypothetical protein